jgi:hypothetical protein
MAAAPAEHELVLRLDAEELSRLEAALRRVAGTSRAAARLEAAIHHALENGNVLVLGVKEGARPEDEDDLRNRILELVERMVPDLEIPSDAAAVLARRNAKRRAELLQEFGALTGGQIADERSRAANRHALAARWRKEGKVFGVSYRGQTLYPGFQFDQDGRVRPAVAEVLKALPRDKMSDWEVALWWTTANGWLGGRRPVDLLDRDHTPLIVAARKLAQPLPL